MAEVPVSGGRIDNDTTQHDLYTADAGCDYAIVNVSIKNGGGSAAGAGLTHATGGGADAPADEVLDDAFSLPSKETWFSPTPFILGPGDKLRVTAGTANVVVFRYHGLEVTA